jgi:hypothetical protein
MNLLQENPLQEGDIQLLCRNDPSVVKYSGHGNTERLALALQGNTNLQELELFLSLERPLSVGEANTLAAAIQQTKVIRLVIGGLILVPGKFRSAVPSFNELLTTAVNAVASNIQELCLTNFFLRPSDCDYEPLMNSLSKLRLLEIKGFYPDNVLPLFHNLHRSTTLTKLLFSYGAGFTEQDMSALSEGLAHNMSIMELSLRQCHIDDDGVKGFVQYWHPDSPIRSMDWSSNRIKGKGAIMLLQAASNHHAMYSLDLSYNYQIGYVGLAGVALEIEHIVLKEIQIGDVCPETNERLCRTFIAPVILQGVKDNTHLVQLNLSRNGFDTHFLTDVHFYLLRNKCRPLMLSTMSAIPQVDASYQLPSTIWCHVFANRKLGLNAHAIVFYFLKEQPALWSHLSEQRTYIR